jgi:uncharacterized protein DUF4416
MCQAGEPVPALLVIAAFSRHEGALDWTRQRLIDLFGPIALTSPSYDFRHTTYYETEMGSGLRKLFFVHEQLVDPGRLAEIKRQTIALEEELARSGRFHEVRPLNLDPGLLNLGKFMLATTKDQAHRIYLRDGIFAEVTLRYQEGEFRTWPWTYRDYQEPFVREFLLQARDFYRQRLALRYC